MKQSIDYKSSHFGNIEIACVDMLNIDQTQLKDFPAWFLQNGVSIHDDRNLLKVFEDEPGNIFNCACVIKAFKVPNFINRVVYSYFRHSKARRSFENSLVFIKNGFSVPEPLAFIHYKKNTLLADSFFVSRKLDVLCSLHEVYRGQSDFHWEEVLPLAVERAYLMHQKNLLHKDYSPGNILLCGSVEQYFFSFVDLNRLQLGGVSFEQGLKSFLRLAHDEKSARIIAETYARLCGKDINYAVDYFSGVLEKHQRFVRLKKGFKRVLGL